MFNQVFVFGDLGTICLLIALEALLSADNALILAIIVRHLPKDQQKKALFYGLAGAFVLRLGAIVVATSIISFWWLQGMGAAYLIYLPVSHFIKQKKAHHKGKEGAGFWMTVVYAELSDLAFAIDSVLVAVAIEPHKQKIWVVYVGAVIGIVLLRFAAGYFLKLLEKYPFLDHVAYALVGWAGVKLAIMSAHTFELWFAKRNPGVELPFYVPEMHAAIFWSGIILIAVGGGYLAVKRSAFHADKGLIREYVEEIEGD
jgi:YkoY family integral membrane protein